MSRQSIFSLHFFNALLFNICMVMQLFLVCFYGNELTLQSSKIKETLYEMDWASLRRDSKFNIVTMMICASKPIVISSGSVIKLNISSFISVSVK
ncbi:odorant receptor 94a-like [Belonocnema kinseyi]|uniref:odorant receptor 94a-like n=1 Tax=Belonocnema kinseyi TaxID=2817044 RepID=UPI00143DB83F|nr:odorant receptor 94a-like [Belonocnema kinseyi]